MTPFTVILISAGTKFMLSTLKLHLNKTEIFDRFKMVLRGDMKLIIMLQYKVSCLTIYKEQSLKASKWRSAGRRCHVVKWSTCGLKAYATKERVMKNG